MWPNGARLPRSHLRHAVYVCICNGVTEHDIRRAAEAGCGSVAELTMRTGCGACCGTCMETASALLEESRPSAQLVALPLVSRAA